MIWVRTLSSALGVSTSRQAQAVSLSFRAYFSAMARACSAVEGSAAAGPEAIMSSGSPRMSDSTTASTLAGAQWRANRPPFTLDSCLRMVLISTMSAPLAKSCRVMSCNSSAGMRSCSKRALPPPDSRSSTVSVGSRSRVSSSTTAVARKLSSSGTGWPAS